MTRAAVLISLFVSLLPPRAMAGPQTRPEPEPIFNGNSFAGWLHEDSHWTIEEGAIVGEIPDGEQLRRNLFLFWEGELHDFDLRLQFRISGGPSANSGVQFRSQRLPDGGAVGYQADLDDGAVWLGRIYDEHGRALIAERGTDVTIATDGARTVRPFRPADVYRELIRPGEWNDYRVRAVGPRIEVFVNGERACVLTDNQVGEQDFSGKLAFQLHSGPGPARIEFRDVRLAQLGRTELPAAPAVSERTPPRPGERDGVEPRSGDGEPLNLGFEKGSLEGWTVRGEAWDRQPIKGDTVAPRRPGQASGHAGEYWVGGYELLGDAPRGTLESAPFEVTHPYASFLVGGGPHHETRVEVVDAASDEVIFRASGKERENLEPVSVDLRKLLGRKIAVRVVDEHAGAWGHVNYDDFRFHDEPPALVEDASIPQRLRGNPILAHLGKNTAGKDAPSSPAGQTVASMYLPEGFRAELIAAEPDLVQPIAFAIDERGRLWVAEALSYPQRRPAEEARDRITIFADEDGDGRFETRKVFTEGLNLVSGLEVGYGGVWVGAAPELLFIPDADRDDVPDAAPRVLLDGWGYQDTHETLNSFLWGPDGWLYGNQGVFNTSHIGKPGAAERERVEMRAGVWRYHPVRHEFEVFAHGGSNQWGLDYNERGELFMTQCRSFWGGGPTTHIVLRGHYWNQANSRHVPFVSGDHPPGAPHLRNFLRASARYGHGEGGAGKRGSRALYGGHSHVGTMIYLGDNWPAEYRDHLFTHNLHGHQINHQINERRGAGYETVHAGSDVLYVDDPLYVAVDLAYGPDGAVYMIDWYDRQHCHSPHLERWDRTNGRIYRMAYAATFEPRVVDLARASDLELVDAQEHANAWYGRTARRLLAERAATGRIDDEAIAALRRSLGTDAPPVAALRALWALHGIGALERSELVRLLEHDDEHLRAWSIRLATERGPADGALVARFEELARADPSALVRLALASYTADAPAEQAWQLAGKLALHAEDAGDAYLPRMIWYGIAPHVEDDLERAFTLAAATRIPHLRDFVLWYAARTAGGRERIVASIDTSRAEAARGDLELVLFALRSTGAVSAPGAWNTLAPKLYVHDDRGVRDHAERLGALFGDETVLARMRAALRGTNDERARKRAFEILEGVADQASVPAFLDLLSEPEYRTEVIGLLARFDDPEIAPALVERFGELSQAERARAVHTLVSRASFARPFLEGIVAGEIDRSCLNSFHVRQLRSLRDERVNTLVTEVYGEARETTADSSQRIAELGKVFREAPLWAYDTGAGRRVFEEHCITCHVMDGQGENAGPDLSGSGRNGVDYFLESVLDPNAVVGEDYQLTVIVTKGGAVLSGLVRDETDETVTLRTVEETVVLEKAAIASRERQTASLMPEGLFENLTERQIIELLKYLTSLR